MGLFDFWKKESNDNFIEIIVKTPDKIEESSSIQEDVKALREDVEEIRERIVREPGWNPITKAQHTDKDLEPLKHERMLKIAHRIWDSTALGKRVIEIRKNVIVSEGFDVIAKSEDEKKNKKIQDFINKFWKLNQLEERMDTLVQELLISGELIMVAKKPNKFSSVTKLYPIFAENVVAVIHDINNPIDMDKIILQEEEDNGSDILDIIEKEYKVIRRNKKDELEGDVFLLAINRPLGGTRGKSDLIHVADFIDMHRKMAIAEWERAKLSRSFVYDVEVEGSDKDLEKVQEAHKTPPTSGSVLFHTNREKWKTLQPQLTLFDTVGFLKYLEGVVLGGMGIPEHWFYEQGSVNKSKAAAMDSPVFAWARQTKKLLMSFLETIVEFAISNAKDTEFKGFNEEDLRFEVISRDPDRGAYDEIGEMLTSMGNALSMAVGNGWVANNDAGAVYRRLSESLGIGELVEPSEEDLDEMKKIWELKLKTYDPETGKETGKKNENFNEDGSKSNERGGKPGSRTDRKFGTQRNDIKKGSPQGKEGTTPSGQPRKS